MQSLDTLESTVLQLIRALENIATVKHDPQPFHNLIMSIASNQPQIEIILQAIQHVPFDKQTKKLVVLMLSKVLDVCELDRSRVMVCYLRVMFSWNVSVEQKELLKRGMFSLMVKDYQQNKSEIMGLFNGTLECFGQLIQQIAIQESNLQYRLECLPNVFEGLSLRVTHPQQTGAAIETFLLMLSWCMERSNMTIQFEQIDPNILCKSLKTVRKLLFQTMSLSVLSELIPALYQLCQFYFKIIDHALVMDTNYKQIASNIFFQWPTIANDIKVIYQIEGTVSEEGIWDYLGCQNSRKASELLTLKTKASELFQLYLNKAKQLSITIPDSFLQLRYFMPHLYLTISNYLSRPNKQPTDQENQFIGNLTLVMAAYAERQKMEGDLGIKIFINLVMPLMEWALEMVEDECQSGSALLNTLLESCDSSQCSSFLSTVNKLAIHLFQNNSLLYTFLLDCLQCSFNTLLDISLPKTSAVIDSSVTEIPIFGLKQLFLISTVVYFYDEKFYQQLCKMVQHYLNEKNMLVKMGLGQKHYFYLMLNDLWSGFEQSSTDEIGNVYQYIISSDQLSQTIQAFKIELVTTIFEDQWDTKKAIFFLAHLHTLKARDAIEQKWKLVSLITLSCTGEFDNQELATIIGIMKMGLLHELNTISQKPTKNTISQSQYLHYISICKSLANKQQKIKDKPMAVVILLSFCQLLDEASGLGLDKGIGQILCALMPILANQFHMMKPYFDSTLEQMLRVLRKRKFRGDWIVLFVLKYMNAIAANRAEPPIIIHQSIIESYHILFEKGNPSVSQQLTRSWKALLLVQTKFLTWFGSRLSNYQWVDHDTCYIRTKQLLEHCEDESINDVPTNLRLMGQLKIIEVLIDQRIGKSLDYANLKLCGSLRIFSQSSLYYLLFLLSGDLDKETALQTLDTAICLLAYHTYNNLVFGEDFGKDPLEKTHKTIDGHVFKDSLATQTYLLLKRCNQLYRQNGMDLRHVFARDKLQYVEKCIEKTIYLDHQALKIENKRLRERSEILINTYYTEKQLFNGRNPELQRKIIKVAGIRTAQQSQLPSIHQVPPKRNRYESSSEEDEQQEEQVVERVRSRRLKKIYVVEKMFEQQMQVTAEETSDGAGNIRWIAMYAQQ